VKDLLNEEWDFSKCPKGELKSCLEYERTRTRADVVELVQKWRSSAKEQSFFEYLQISPDPITWLSSEYAFMYFPEWPTKPYLTVSPRERENRLQHFSFAPSAETCIQAYPIGDSWPTLDLRYDSESGFLTNRARHPYSEYILIQLPWGYSSDREIMAAFESALKNLRPKQFSNYRKVGAGSQKRSIPDKLKKLGASRIYDHAGWNRCLDYELPGYNDQPSFSRAKKATELEINGPVIAACSLYQYLHSKNNS